VLEERSVLLRGAALHHGGQASVRLVASSGPLVIEQRGAALALDALRVVRADRGVTIASPDGRISLDLVEHLFAAIGALGVHRGLRVVTDDPELPLLDGGALRFAAALSSLALARFEPALVITREATLRHKRSIYRFAPFSSSRLEVEVDFRAPVGKQRARWDGDARDFIDRIAPARTFGWIDELEALRAAGRAAGVDLASVMVFDEHGTIEGSAPQGPDEAARHKLLDLIGDLALYGGPPRGFVAASLPGHAATHAIVAEALELGVLVEQRS